MCGMVKTVLRYGTILTDIQLEDKEGNFFRIYNIKLDNHIYYLVLKNGEEYNFKII